MCLLGHGERTYQVAQSLVVLLKSPPGPNRVSISVASPVPPVIRSTVRAKAFRSRRAK